MKTVHPLEAAIAALASALREAGAPFMLIGGVAVIARGVARVTTDVDATVRAEGPAVDELSRILARHQPASATRARRRRASSSSCSPASPTTATSPPA